MNRPLKTALLVVTALSVITMPIVSLAAVRSGSPGVSHSQPLSRSGPTSSLNLGSVQGLTRRVEATPRLQSNAVQPLNPVVPNVTLNPTPANPAATRIHRDTIRRIAPPLITSPPVEVKPNPLGQASFPAAITKVDPKLGPAVPSLVKNLAEKDKILKLKNDFLASPAKIGLGDLPKLEQAKSYATKSLFLSPKCAWWVHWYYHCYWHTCHHWYWDYWYPIHFHVIHSHAGYSYYFGAELFVIPGIGLGVASVNPGSPADQAGLAIGDVIISANGEPLQRLDAGDVMKHVIQTSGGVLNMEVLRETADQPMVMTALLQRMYHYSY